jgi:hypothetical protein
VNKSSRPFVVCALALVPVLVLVASCSSETHSASSSSGGTDGGSTNGGEAGALPETYYEPAPASSTPPGEWGTIDADLPKSAFRITGLVSSEGKTYLAGGEYKSTSGGLFQFEESSNTWVKKATHETSGALTVGADKGVYMLVQKSLRRYRSGGGVAGWESLASSPLDGDMLFANPKSTQGMLYSASEKWEVARYAISSNTWESIPTGGASLDPSKLSRSGFLTAMADETVFLSTPWSIRDSKGALGAVYAWTAAGGWKDATYNLREEKNGLPTHMLNQTGSGWGSFGSVALGPSESDAVYASTEQGMFRLAEGTSTWEKVHAYSGNTQMRVSDSYLFLLQNQVQLFETATRRRPLGKPKLFGCNKETWEELTAPSKTLVIGVMRIAECGGGKPDGQRVLALRVDETSPTIDRNMKLDVGTYLGGGTSCAQATEAECKNVPKGPSELAWNEAGTELYVVGQTSPTSSTLYRVSAQGTVMRSLALGTVAHDLVVRGPSVVVATDAGLRTYAADLLGSPMEIPMAQGGKRLARAKDGAMASIAGKTVTLYNAAGAKEREVVLTRAYVNDVAIDADTVYVVGFDNQRNGEPVQVPFLVALARTDLSVRWKAWGNDPSTLSNDMADSRLYRVSLAEDGDVLVLGEFAGGNTVFRWNGQDLTTPSLVAYDDTTRATNTKSEHKTYYARVGRTDGKVKLGQFAIARLPNGSGNSIRAGSIASDSKGRVLVGATSAAFMAGRDLNLVNGAKVGEYSDGDAAYLAVSKDMKTRLRFTPFSKSGGNGMIRAIDVSATGTVAALALSEKGELFTTDGSTALFPQIADPRDNLFLALFREP